MSERDDIIALCAKVAEDAADDPALAVRTEAGPLCSAHTPGIIADRIRALAKPVERTPETVLRAMLKAYEAARFAHLLAWERGEAFDRGRSGRVAVCADAIEKALLNVLAHDGMPAWHEEHPCRADYEARLSGARPLDAPPMEEP